MNDARPVTPRVELMVALPVSASAEPSNVRLAESVNAPAAATYGMRFAVSDETVRFVVEAVPKYPVPLTESAVELAYGNVFFEVEVTVIAPVESMVVVAVAPKYAFWNTERSEVEAAASDWVPVKVPPEMVGVTSVGDVPRTTSPVPVQVKRLEVLTTVGTAAAPVMLAQRELAAIAAKPIVAALPPT